MHAITESLALLHCLWQRPTGATSLCRVGIDLILERYKAGVSPEQIAEEFETTMLEDIYATITYYLRHKQRLDAWLDDRAAWTERHGQSKTSRDTTPTPLQPLRD
jgi:hypothetical protein